MDFIDVLRPSYLWALPIAAGPLVIHLLSRRKKRIVEFSSISLLLTARQKNVERLNLREILLLVMRTLIVLFLILAMARPIVRGIGGSTIDDHEPTGIVMLLDGTLSMQYASAGETNFERAVNRMREVIRNASPEDRVRILVCGRSPASSGPVEDLRPHEAAARLDLLEPTYVHGTLDGCLERSLANAREMDLSWREVHVFSDLQASSFGSGLPEGAPGDIPIVFLSAGVPDPVNRFVGTADLVQRQGASEKPWSVRTLVGMSGSTGEPAVFPRLYLDEDMQGIVEVQASGEESVPAVFSLESYPGSGRRIRVEIDRDGLSADDVRFLVTGDETPLLITRNGRIESSLPLGLALDLIQRRSGVPSMGDKREGSGGDLEVRSQNPPSRVHVTFWSDREGIREAIESGFGLMLFPDPGQGGTGPGGLIPIEVGDEKFLGDGRFQAVRLPMDTGTPAGVALLSDGLGRIRVSRYHRIGIPEKPALPAGSWAVHLENGDPLFLGGEVGGSRIVVWAVSPRRESSTLFTTPLFVPLLDALLRYAAGGRVVDEYLCGEPLVRSLSGVGAGEALRVRLPGGGEIAARTKYHGVLEVDDTAAPGFYAVARGGEVVDQFAVNVDTEESDLTEIEISELEERYAPRDVTVVRTDGDLEKSIFTSRGGKDLSFFLLASVFVLVLIESLVSGKIRAG